MFWYDRDMLKATSIYLDAADMKKLERIAKKDGLKASYLVRKAIKEFLRRTKG
jgi:predicted transcriptional regulator